PLEENASTHTDISGVHSSLEDQRDVRDWTHPIFVPFSCGFDYRYWDPRFPYPGYVFQKHGAEAVAEETRSSQAYGGRLVQEVLESLRDIMVGSTVTKSDRESARFEILAGFAAIARPLEAVPEAVRDATRELLSFGLLEEAAGSGPAPEFRGVAKWPLPAGRWTSTRADAKKRMKAVKAWGTTMLAGLAVAPALVGGSGAPGPVSAGKRDSWSVDCSKQVSARVLAEGAKLREALLRFRSEHSWKRPGQALEAHDFPEMVWARPMLEDEGCDIDELPRRSEASTDDWCVQVHFLRGRVTAMQVFARGKDPGARFEDVMDDSFARKRARSPSPPAAAKRVHFDPAVAAGGGSTALALMPGRRDDLAQRRGCAP
ncbi:hypothetical protein CYMTET_43215, partial [Cymbomonas tetramitiformis]